MKVYLNPTDPGAFDGLEKQQPEPCSKMLGRYSTPRVDSGKCLEPVDGSRRWRGLT